MNIETHRRECQKFCVRAVDLVLTLKTRMRVGAVGNRGLCGFPRAGGRVLGVHGAGRRPDTLHRLCSSVFFCGSAVFFCVFLWLGCVLLCFSVALYLFGCFSVACFLCSWWRRYCPDFPAGCCCGCCGCGLGSKLPPSARWRFTRCTRCSAWTRINADSVALSASSRCVT